MSDHWTTFDRNHPACREEATELIFDFNCMGLEPPRHAKVKGVITLSNWEHDADCLDIVGDDAELVRAHIINTDPDVVAKIYQAEFK